jgi:hypothetical protein
LQQCRVRTTVHRPAGRQCKGQLEHIVTVLPQHAGCQDFA